MPTVDGKTFPYTPSGKKAAKKAILKKAVKGVKEKETKAEDKTDTMGEKGPGETSPMGKFNFLGKGKK